MLQLLPSDLRPFVIIHDYEDDFAAYPALRGDDMWVRFHPHALSFFTNNLPVEGTSTEEVDFDCQVFHRGNLATVRLRLSCLQASGHRATYVALSRFMRRYQAYQYAWVLEYDAR